MLKSRIEDSASVIKGFCKVLNAHLQATSSNIEHIKQTSQNLDDIKNGLNYLKSKINQNPIKIIVSLLVFFSNVIIIILY